MLEKARHTAVPDIAKSKPGFYQNLVYKQLGKMKLGRLFLHLPDGEIVGFGNGEHDLRASVRVNDPEFFKRVVLFGDIGFGEAYTEGLWDTESVTDVVAWVLLNIEHAPGVSGSRVRSFSTNVLRFLNKIVHNGRANTMAGARKNISAHYDLSNDFFATFLDPTLTYSSAYFRTNDMTLEEAQAEKYDRLCRKLNLQHTDHVLEIGSGWGANAIHMARNYGCRVTSLTLSVEQQQLATQRIAAAGLSHRVKVLLQDYRTISGKFDKIVSIEMLEAVGHRYLKSYFRKCAQLLEKDGLLAVQVIICPDSRYHSLRKGVDWIQKHIFPGSLLPSVGAMNGAINATGDLTMIDLKEFGLHYAKTLRLWLLKFLENLSLVQGLGFDEAFIRKWIYYLCYCEAAFLMRNIGVIQVVYSRPNNTRI
nr:cyclopropane-fatty-acyl-phospholipid synthase family protein [uncultured Dyadobacter sp.]